jgi:hypothetical protein
VWIRQPGGQTSRFADDDGTLLGVSELDTLDDTEVLVLDPPGLVPGSSVAVECHFERVAERPQDLFQVQQPFPVARTSISVDGLRASAEVQARGAMRLAYAGEHGEHVRPERLRESVYDLLSGVLPVIGELEVDGVSAQPDGRWTFGFRVSSSSDAVLADFGSVRVLELGALLELDELPVPASDSMESAFLPMLGIIREEWTIEYEGWSSAVLSPPLEVTSEVGHARLETHGEPGRIRMS